MLLRKVASSVVRRGYYTALRGMPLAFRRRVLYRRGVGSWPNIDHPNKFTEKLNWRILYDRRSILEISCDKDAMKYEAKRLAGDLVRVPETIWFGTDVRQLSQLRLPEKWVLKPNHRAGRVLFGEGSKPSADELEVMVEDWLEELNGSTFGEWAYTKARRAIILEEFIGAGTVPPSDYKVYVFDGTAHLIQFHDGRFSNHSCRYYDRSWNALPVRNRAYDLAPLSKAPERLDDMLLAAEKIADGFDFLRVDFYFIEGIIWFGEVSPYPAGGISRFDPPEFDFELGKQWSLPLLPASN